MYGSLNGMVGLFPAEYVKPLARHEVETSSSKPVLYQSKLASEVVSNEVTSSGTKGVMTTVVTNEVVNDVANGVVTGVANGVNMRVSSINKIYVQNK